MVAGSARLMRSASLGIQRSCLAGWSNGWGCVKSLSQNDYGSAWGPVGPHARPPFIQDGDLRARQWFGPGPSLGPGPGAAAKAGGPGPRARARGARGPGPEARGQWPGPEVGARGARDRGPRV